jgi:hypothetical protein
MDEDVEHFYGSYIITSILKIEFIREGQVIIVRIRKPKGIGETFEEKLKELADVLVNGYGWGSFSISLETFGNLNFPFLIVG